MGTERLEVWDDKLLSEGLSEQHDVTLDTSRARGKLSGTVVKLKSYSVPSHFPFKNFILIPGLNFLNVFKQPLFLPQCPYLNCLPELPLY